MKKAIAAVLLLFVLASVVYLIASEGRQGPKQDSEASTAVTTAAPTGQKTSGDDPLGRSSSRPASEAKDAVGEKASGASDVAAVEAVTPQRTIMTYYFHGTQRCRTCLTMEAYSKEALQNGLPDALESGTLEFRAVNMEQPENKHFVKEYELYASALVMVEIDGGAVKRWKNLERIWDLVGDEAAFKSYVQSEAKAYLESES